MTINVASYNDSPNQNDEMLFSRISNDLSKKGYSININALPFGLANKLYEEVSAMTDESFKKAEMGRNSERVKNVFVRNQKLSWIMGNSVTEQLWLNWANGMQHYLNQHLFLGLFSFESHYARYGPGDFYKRHYDAFKGETSRILSVVVYFNRNWLSNDGGELILYKQSDDRVGLKIKPSFATVVVFLSADFPHEVLLTNRERDSIAGWFSPNTTTATHVAPPR